MANDTILLGSLYACIAGDHRYGDTLRVEWIPASGSVKVSVRSSGAVGGMDGDGRSYDAGEQYTSTCQPDPHAVLALIKGVIDQDRFAFKKYGKPTKRFSWVEMGPGLSLRHVKEAISRVKESARWVDACTVSVPTKKKNPNVTEIYKSDDVIKSSYVRLGAGMRPRRVVLRHSPSGAYVAQLEYLRIDVVTEVHNSFVYDVIKLSHEEFDGTRYFTYNQDDGMSESDARAAAFKDFKQRIDAGF